MIIREYNPEDITKIAELFYGTVHGVCARDYTKEQLNAWAAEDMDRGSQLLFVTGWKPAYLPVRLQHMLP